MYLCITSINAKPKHTGVLPAWNILRRERMVDANNVSAFGYIVVVFVFKTATLRQTQRSDPTPLHACLCVFIHFLAPRSRGVYNTRAMRGGLVLVPSQCLPHRCRPGFSVPFCRMPSAARSWQLLPRSADPDTHSRPQTNTNALALLRRHRRPFAEHKTHTLSQNVL